MIHEAESNEDFNSAAALRILADRCRFLHVCPRILHAWRSVVHCTNPEHHHMIQMETGKPVRHWRKICNAIRGSVHLALRRYFGVMHKNYVARFEENRRQALLK